MTKPSIEPDSCPSLPCAVFLFTTFLVRDQVTAKVHGYQRLDDGCNLQSEHIPDVNWLKLVGHGGKETLHDNILQ